MYLFGFGSLINLNSAQKSFERELSYKDLIPVRVKGLKKVWNSIEQINFDGKDTNGVFLNLQKDENSSTNGVVVKLSQEEFEVLKQREKNYSQVIIKAQDVQGANLDEDVIAFMTTNEEKLAKVGDENTYIPAKYIDILTAAFEHYDEEFVNEYKKEALEEFPFPLKQGIYKFSDPLQNKLAKEGIRK
ncbi:gamma-glutamylcyclotransferase [Halarcobacter sp.]|uniref:gamma-glutamylcyclotransferase n=1 Tax=Halarcobacter sp. TaxID=2321133 RepID=UPI003AFF63B8